MPAAGAVPAEQALVALAVSTGAALLRSGLRVVTVESCTGGYLAKLLTDLAGSSAWFECGYVTYSNAAKQRDVGVTPQTLLMHGAVSQQTVLEMAQGALLRTGADLALSISGVAGPGGATLHNAVGSVWMAWAVRGPGGAVEVTAEHQQFAGDRDAVRRQSVARALRGLQQRAVRPAL